MPDRRFSKMVVPLLLAAFISVCAAAHGADLPPSPETGREPPAAESKELITINFKDVELPVLIKFMSELTGKNFLVDPGVKGFVTIHCPEKVTIDEAYKVFLSVLEVHGFTVVESGKVIKIVPTAAAKTKGLDLLRERSPGASAERMVTYLVKLKLSNAGELAKVLAPLVEKTGLLIPYPETNTLIMTDMSSNIERLVKIVQDLDVSGERVIHVFQLKYAKAEDLGKRLQTFFQEEKTRREFEFPVRIMADARTNSIVVQADQKAMINIRPLMLSMDQEVQRPRENVHVYALKYAVAERLAKVLTELPGKGGGQEAQQDPTKPVLPAPLSKNVQISADKSSNSLIIVADPEEYQILQEVIQRLDMPRPMVYVEALIVEVSASKALDLGVEWRVGNQYGGGLGNGNGGFFFGGNTGPSQDLSNFPTNATLPSGFAAGVIGNGIKLGNVTFPSIGAFVRAVRTDTDFNIISTPQILTLDNEEASINVSQNIPFQTTSTIVGTTGQSQQSYEYKDVGINLKVTPQINYDRFVRLTIEESVKSIISDTALHETVLAPSTNVRTAKAAISVKDGETVVMGGLIENRLNRSQTMTPCLGNVPFLGWLFKTVSDRDDKTNLLVFLTPSVVWSREEANAIFQKKKEAADNAVKGVVEKGQKEEMRRKAME